MSGFVHGVSTALRKAILSFTTATLVLSFFPAMSYASTSSIGSENEPISDSFGSEGALESESLPTPLMPSQPETSVQPRLMEDEEASFEEDAFILDRDETLTEVEVVPNGLDDEASMTRRALPGAHVMYRLYNPNSGEHFYTESSAERDTTVQAGWNYEGLGWYAPDSSRSPVYRLYSGTDHHYTMDAAERDMLVGAGWSDEGIGWYSDDAKGIPLYRQFNPNVDPNAATNNSGSHNYTTSKAENDQLVKTGWHAEGIGWYGVDSSAAGVPGSSGSGDPNANKPGSGSQPPTSQAAINEVKKYSYRIMPVNGKLNNIFFVETNNPDPYSFQFSDPASTYKSRNGEVLIRPLPYAYGDVVYTDAATKRIANKGYLFYCYECNTDGGSLDLMANIGYYYENHGNYASYSYGTNYDTGINVNCAVLEDRADYLIRTYTGSSSDFFGKLDAVQSGLTQIALYPKRVRDSSKPNTSGRSCPLLAASPYPELSLNMHVESMYEEGDPLLISSAYGFVLDSLGFPGMIGTVAERLQPNCKVESGSNHYQVNVTYDGSTRTYGGAGTGSTYPIYTAFTSKTFKFDGTDAGYGTNLSLSTLRAKRLEYASKSDAFAQDSLAKLSVTEVGKVVSPGAWIKCAAEGYLGYGTTLCYAACGPSGGAVYASNAWVNGRYVGQNEMYVKNAKFEDHPTAAIILEDVSYTDKKGASHKSSIVYAYNASTDSWRAPWYYFPLGESISSEELKNLPAEFILTRAQVNEMKASGKLDGNTATPPAPKYIYDGTAEPGTPC